MDYVCFMVIEYLRTRPLIKIRPLEIAAGIPEGMLDKALKGKRKLPKKHEKALIAILKEYGFKGK